jgi:hypothetical protein
MDELDTEVQDELAADESDVRVYGHG